MVDEVLKRDQNFVTVLGGITDDSDQDITMLRVDPITKRLLVKATGSGFGTVTSISSGTGILATPDPITTTGTIALSTSLQPVASLTGNSLKFLRVNAGETAVEYATVQSGLTIGTTTISSGTTTRILYDNAGILGEYTITGTGTVVAMATSPSFTTPTLGVAIGTSLSVSGLLASATGLTLEETGAGTDIITLQAPSSISASYTLTLPIDDGTPNQVLTTDGAGVLSWTTPTTGTVTSVSGTVNRITSTGGATPVIDISASYVGQSSITTLGTIATGVWNGTTIAIANGGSGQTTANAALNAFLPSQGGNSGKFLTTNGSDTSWATVSSGGITIGTTTITGGTTTRILYDNAGVVGEYTISGSGTVVAMATSPVLTSATITTKLTPTSNDGAPLGDTTHQFSDLFLAEGGVINWDNGDATITQVNNVVTLAGADLALDNITAGSILFSGTSGLVSQDNTYLFFDDANNQIKSGTTAFDGNSQIIFNAGRSINNYTGFYLQNTSNGDTAGTDLILGNDIDNAAIAGHYIDTGIVGSGWSGVSAALGIVKTVSVNTAGSGYSVNDVLTLTGGSNDCTVKVLTINGSGGVLTVSIVSNGTNYTVTNFNVTGGGGSGAKINVLTLFDFTGFSASDGYTYVSGGNLNLAVDDSVAGKVIKFLVNGLATTNEIGRFSTTGLTVGLTGTLTGLVKFAGSTSTFISIQGAAVGNSSALTLLPHTANIATSASTTETSNAATVVAIAALTHTHTITALAVADTFGIPTIASGSLDNTYTLIIRIKDNGTARALAFNAIFRAGTIALPTTTIVNKTMYLGFKYNVTDTKWDFVSYVDNL